MKGIRRYLSLPEFDDVNVARRARLTQVMAITMSVLSTPFIVIAACSGQLGPAQWGTIGICIAAMSACASAYVLVMRRRVYLAALIVLIVLFAGCAAWLVGFAGPKGDLIPLVFPALIVLSGLLLGHVEAIVASVAGGLALCMGYIAFYLGWRVYETVPGKMWAFEMSVGVGVLVLCGVLVRLSVKQFYSALEQMQHSERELARTNAELSAVNLDLEARVRERTIEIEQMAARQGQLQTQIIDAQQALIRELEAPIERVWNGVVSMSLIGAVDSTRAQGIIQSLLHGIERHAARVAIISVAGVPVVDTATARTLIQAVQAARLLGCECVLVGVRTDVAATLVELGLDLAGIQTMGNVQDALEWGLNRLGLDIVDHDSASARAALRALLAQHGDAR